MINKPWMKYLKEHDEAMYKEALKDLCKLGETFDDAILITNVSLCEVIHELHKKVPANAFDNGE